jgi:hypothetical protein
MHGLQLVATVQLAGNLWLLRPCLRYHGCLVASGLTSKPGGGRISVGQRRKRMVGADVGSGVREGWHRATPLDAERHVRGARRFAADTAHESVSDRETS